MGRSQESFNKKEREKKKDKKKKDKMKRREEVREESSKGKSLDDMLAYVDEDGNITSTPPDPSKKKKIKAENIEVSVPKKEAPDSSDLIRNGTVTFFNESKGYGFIKDHETQESFFVHVNGLNEEVSENDKVVFETEMGQKGLNAVRVKLLK